MGGRRTTEQPRDGAQPATGQREDRTGRGERHDDEHEERLEELGRAGGGATGRRRDDAVLGQRRDVDADGVGVDQPAAGVEDDDLLVAPQPARLAQLADRVPGVFFGLPLLALASLVFAATRHEDPAAIGLATVHWAVWLGGILGLVLATVLLFGLIS